MLCVPYQRIESADMDTGEVEEEEQKKNGIQNRQTMAHKSWNGWHSEQEPAYNFKCTILYTGRRQSASLMGAWYAKLPTCPRFSILVVVGATKNQKPDCCVVFSRPYTKWLVGSSLCHLIGFLSSLLVVVCSLHFLATTAPRLCG